MVIAGDLGFLDPCWRGWTIRDGRLISPEGWEASVGDVLSLPLLRSQLAIYQAELRKLKADDFEDQPLPDSLAAALVPVKRP
jgi:hypothetical protein